MFIMPIYFDQRKFIKSNPVRIQNAISDYSSTTSYFPRHVGNLKLFLDMDGVLTDFTCACEMLSEHMMLWYGNDKERFWRQITSSGAKFWSDMPWMAGGRELHGFLKNSGFCPTILSALPGQERKKALSDARKGKIQWLRKELGIQYANNAILCFRPEKALQSGASRVLIDDNSENISEWEEAGGTGILHKNTNRTIRCFSKILDVEQKL